jgi:protein involved in polysaccharide export with SLBB domain
MPNAFVKGARMKRANQQAAQTMETISNTIQDNTIVKAQRQINSEQLELRLESILKNPGTTDDYFLKEGDQIIIPEISQEVRILGEVQNPIGLAYQNGKNFKYYINRSGGFNDKAMKKKSFIIYSDGTTKVTHNFLGHYYPAPEPGCQIVIPQKPEKVKTDNSGKWLGFASVIASIALTIATIASL